MAETREQMNERLARAREAAAKKRVTAKLEKLQDEMLGLSKPVGEPAKKEGEANGVQEEGKEKEVKQIVCIKCKTKIVVGQNTVLMLPDSTPRCPQCLAPAEWSMNK